MAALLRKMGDNRGSSRVRSPDPPAVRRGCFPREFCAIHSARSASRPAQRDQGTGVRPPHADSIRRHSGRAGGEGRAGLRDDGQRQDGRLPAADPASADRPSAGDDEGPGADADARAGRAGARGPEGSGGAHAHHGCAGLRRRRHGAAGTCVPQRRRRHHRHAGTPARSLPVAVREAVRAGVPGARRSGPDARHGFPAGDPQDPPPPAAAPPDAVLQRHHAAADRGAEPRDAARSR